MGTEESALAVWKMAFATRIPEKGSIFYSDIGIQYARKKLQI
jgi:hypothetical protein